MRQCSRAHMWYMMGALTLSGITLTHDQILHANAGPFAYCGETHGYTRRPPQPPHPIICPFAHTETNTYYTLTVNRTPCSNTERIVPGLEDIKSSDYPIKSYFAPSPTYAKSAEQTIAPWCEGRVMCTLKHLQNKKSRK